MDIATEKIIAFIEELVKEGIKENKLIALFILIAPCACLSFLKVNWFINTEGVEKIMIGIIVTIGAIFILAIYSMLCKPKLFDLDESETPKTEEERENFQKEKEKYRIEIYKSIFFYEFIIVCIMFIGYFMNCNKHDIIMITSWMFAIMSFGHLMEMLFSGILRCIKKNNTNNLSDTGIIYKILKGIYHITTSRKAKKVAYYIITILILIFIIMISVYFTTLNS